MPTFNHRIRVAVIGAGFAGFAVAWHLLNQGIDVCCIDQEELGHGASSVAAGLLHPFPGKWGKRSFASDEAMKEAFVLIDAAEKALGSPVHRKEGLFRCVMSDSQKEAYLASAKENQDISFIQHPELGAGLWIPEAVVVYSKKYLEGLKKACGPRLEWISKQMMSLEECEGFDHIVLANGYGVFSFFPNLKLKATKGQLLVCKWDQKLPFSLAGDGHITAMEDPEFCQIGSTYERQFLNAEVDPFKALLLQQKVARFYPPAMLFKVIEIKSGVRVSPQEGYLPMAEKVAKNTWVLTGFGSRGLLYHGLFGKKLAEAIRRDQ